MVPINGHGTDLFLSHEKPWPWFSLGHSSLFFVVGLQKNHYQQKTEQTKNPNSWISQPTKSIKDGAESGLNCGGPAQEVSKVKNDLETILVLFWQKLWQLFFFFKKKKERKI